MALFNNIIVPLDGSESSAHALPAAQLMAGAANAKLTLVRTFDKVPEWHCNARWALSPDAMDVALHGHIGAFLWSEKMRLQRKGIHSPVSIETREGPAHEVIAGLANQNPDAIVAMSTRGRGGLARMLHGSVTAKVIGAIRNPTLVVRCSEQDCPVLPNSVDNIIVPLDSTPFSEGALHYAGELATAFGARIILSRSTPAAEYCQVYADWSCMYGGPAFGSYDPQQLVEDSDAKSRDYLLRTADELRSTFPTVETEVMCSRDNPVRAVVGLAGELNNGLVVMASRGRRGFRRALFGSVADQVVRHAPVPTLLVKGDLSRKPESTQGM